MTMQITGSGQRAPWQRAARALIVSIIIFLICLILLDLISGFLVDWLWFSAIGYFGVFWTTVIAEFEVFIVVFTATTTILWVNGSLALRFAQSGWTQRPAEFEWKPTGVVTLPDVLEFTRHRVPWRLTIASGAGLLALLVAWGEVNNWGVFLRFLHQVPYGVNDPLYEKDISFYLFSLPAYIAIKDWMLLTLFLSALFAGAIYWMHGHIEYDPQRRSMSPIVIAHGSVLLGFFFAVKAWSYGLDRYLLLYGDNGVVVGASYTDIHVGLPVLWLLIGLSIVAAFAAWTNVRVRTYRIPLAAAVLVDVGISVDSAVDVAKEAADMILLEHDLGVLHAGVLEGRRTFGNIMKYIMMGTSSNFGNMFSMAGASLFLSFLPMLPVQILLNNLLYDVSELPIPLDRVDDDYLSHPRHWDMKFIRNFMLVIGPVSSVFDFLTFYIMLAVLNGGEALFRTGWFIESMATQVLVIFIIRTRKNPFRSRPNPWLVACSLTVVAVAALLPFTPAGVYLGFVAPPASFFVILAAILIFYLLAVEGMKQWFFRRFATE